MRIGNSSIPVTLLLEISNITNTDYKYVQSRQQVVRFEPGEAYKEVDVSILVNTNENRNERFAASLLKDSNDERIVLNEWNTNVTILDDTYISCKLLLFVVIVVVVVCFCFLFFASVLEITIDIHSIIFKPLKLLCSTISSHVHSGT